MTEVRNLATYLDEAGQCRVEELNVMVALVTNGTRTSEEHLELFAQQLHLAYGTGWKAQQWKRRDVIRLAALIRAKGWYVLRGFYKPPGDLDSVARNFIDYAKQVPLIDEPLREELIREAEALQPHTRVWLLALYDTVKTLHLRDQIATGKWVFHTRTAPTEPFLSHYLDFCLGAQNPEAWTYLHTTYRHIPLIELFKVSFQSDHAVDGLRIVDYCAHFFRRTITPFGNEATVDMAGHELFTRVLETSCHHEDILPPHADIILWINTVADLYELVGRVGQEEARRQYDPYAVRVLEWMLKARFL